MNDILFPVNHPEALSICAACHDTFRHLADERMPNCLPCTMRMVTHCGDFIRLGNTDYVCTRNPGHFGAHVAKLNGKIICESSESAVSMAGERFDLLIKDMNDWLDTRLEVMLYVCTHNGLTKRAVFEGF